MIYTNAMNKLLNSQDDEVEAIMRHYLDNYFKKCEEPEFKETELKRMWFFLLIDGLVEEMRENGKKCDIAYRQLSRLLTHNAKWFENNALGRKESRIYTIAEAEALKRKRNDALSGISQN